MIDGIQIEIEVPTHGDDEIDYAVVDVQFTDEPVVNLIDQKDVEIDLISRNANFLL